MYISNPLDARSVRGAALLRGMVIDKVDYMNKNGQKTHQI